MKRIRNGGDRLKMSKKKKFNNALDELIDWIDTDLKVGMHITEWNTFKRVKNKAVELKEKYGVTKYQLIENQDKIAEPVFESREEYLKELDKFYQNLLPEFRKIDKMRRLMLEKRKLAD